MLLHSKTSIKNKLLQKGNNPPFPHIELYVDKIVHYVQLYNIESYNPKVKKLIFNSIKKRTYVSDFFDN